MRSYSTDGFRILWHESLVKILCAFGMRCTRILACDVLAFRHAMQSHLTCDVLAILACDVLAFWHVIHSHLACDVLAFRHAMQSHLACDVLAFFGIRCAHILACDTLTFGMRCARIFGMRYARSWHEIHSLLGT